jgi:hypothetical protein
VDHRPNMYRFKDTDQLAQWMRDNEMTCREVAALSGCSYSTVANLRAGRKATVNEHIARGICLTFEAELEDHFEPTGLAAWQRGTLAVRP